MGFGWAAAGAAVLLCCVAAPGRAASGPDAHLSSSALSFPSRAVGTAGDAQEIVLTNSGDAPLTISTFRITGEDPGDFAQGSGCPINPDALAPGSSCSIYVSFTPHAEGPRSATFTIGSDAVSGPQVIELTGSGATTPQAVLSPGALAYGSAQVGTQTASQTVTVTNTGSATLLLSAIRIVGIGSADFTRMTTCDLVIGLPPGGSCVVDIAFAPQSTGDRPASLALDDNAPGSPHTVSLSGTGTAPPGPGIELGASALDFGLVTVGTTSAPRDVSLRNTGDASLALQSIMVTAGDTDFFQSDDCPASLAPGAGCTISVTLTPTATGARAGALTISSDAPSSPSRIALAGTSVQPGTYLSDDFEAGSLDRWDALSSQGSTISLDSSFASSGSSSVRFTNSGDEESSRLMADLAGGGHAQTYTRFCFRIAPGVAQGLEIANGRAITEEYPLGIRRFVIDYNPGTKGLEGYFFNESLQRLDLYAATGKVDAGVWHCAELYLDEQANGRAELWLDGASVGAVEGDLSTPSPYSRLYLWDQPAAGSVWFDDVQVAASRIGAVAPGDPAGPTLALSDSSLDFGAQSSGGAGAQRTITLTNAGGADLSVGAIAVTGPDATDFAQSNDCPATLAPRATCAVDITFAPSGAGDRGATLTIGDSSPGSPHSVSLTGVGVAAGMYLDDDFESGSIASWSALSSPDSTISTDSSVANSGVGSVRLTNASDAQSSRLMADLVGGGHAQSYTRFCFRIQPGLTDGIEIANGRAITEEYPLGIRRFVIDYNPATKGLEAYFFNESLARLDMSAANGRVLTGRWYCAELYLDEHTDGHARLWLDGVLVGSVDGDLSTPGTYSRLYLWNQATAGSVWFDDVRVADSPIGPVGAGAGDLPGPHAAFGSPSLTFASQTTGTTSGALTVTLTNDGDSAMTLYGITVTGPDANDFAQTNDCPGILQAGSSCTATVTFAPTATGSRTAALSFSDDASGSPQVVALSGAGAAPDAAVVTLSVTSISFGDQPVEVPSAPRTVVVTNTGTVPLTIGGIAISGDFGETTSCGAALGVGESCTIDVTFSPTATGARSATLTIQGDAVNSPTAVSVVGTGVPPPGTYLTDGFESGFGAWHTIGDGTESVQSVTVNGGTHAAALTNAVAGGYSGIYADFGAQAHTVTRFCFDLVAIGGPAVLAQGRDANGLPLWEVDYDPGYHGLDVYFWNGARTRTDLYTAVDAVTQGQWHCVEVDLDESTIGSAGIKVDGIPWASTQGDFSAADAYGRLFLWNNGAAGTVYVDDVSVTAS